MKTLILNNLMGLVKTYNPDYDNDKLDEVRYGLEGIYLTITKLVIITLISIILGILKEYLIILLLFNIIRFTGFGIHANKSIHCLISSTTVFIGVPLLSKYLVIPNNIGIIISIICLIGFLLYAPADTPKRPLVRKKKRIIYKILTIIICIIFTVCSLLAKNNFLHNAFLASMLIELMLIHPLTYKLFGVSYNNYKGYVWKNDVKEGSK